jgi:indole-3-glycerol phosphate synthase
MTILDDIFAAKRKRVEADKNVTDVGGLIDLARETRSKSVAHRFRDSVTNRERVNIIAEFKRASPSKGLINGSAAPADAARQYESSGARAMSVLTEEDFFQGSMNDLVEARAAVSIPILRKDFIFDEFQIYEAAAAGADAILLIVSSLTPEVMRRLRSLSEDDLGMDALVEVHTVEEMKTAVDIGASLIGVNNRNLKTFEVSLDVSRELIHQAPSDAILISESGLRSRSDIEELSSIGYSGFLIGESLMRSEDPTEVLRGLTGK